MTNRIDNNQAGPLRSQQPDTDDQGVDGADKSSAQESSSVETTDKAQFQHAADVWEQAGTSAYERFRGGAAGENAAPTAGAADIDPGEAKAVWEMMGVGESDLAAAQESARAAEASETSQTEGTDPAPEVESFDIDDNRAASSLANLFDQMEGENPTMRTVQRDLNALVFDGMGSSQQQSLIDLAGHPDELRDHLLEIHDDPKLADRFVDQVQDQVVGLAGERIANQARPQLEAGMESLNYINSSSESRRTFLSMMASGAQNRDNMAKALSGFGLSPSAADDIADGLVEIRDDDEAMSAFLAGEDGERSGFFQLRGDFAQIDSQFERELDSMHQGLESLTTSLDSNQIRHDQFLTDPATAPIRDQVFAAMGAVTEPPKEVNGLGEMFNEVTEDSRKTQRNERFAQAGISIAAGIGFTLATAGLGTAAATGAAATSSAAQSIPDIAEARLDVDRAQAGVNAGLQNPDVVKMAERDRNVAYAAAAANMAISAGAPGAGEKFDMKDVKMGLSAADMGGEGLNAGIEAASTAYDVNRQGD